MSPRPPQERWRRVGWLNIGLTTSCLTIVLICLAVGLSKPNSGIFGRTTIFNGDCKKSGHINISLHLVINIISTGVLASSNYFMQILGSPSRKEIERAHRRFHALDIGIPSAKNVFHISPFKTVSYLVLFFSSIPVHLFFNSSVFEIGYQGSDWKMSIVTQEAFTDNAALAQPNTAGNLTTSLRDIQSQLADDDSSWQRLDVSACLEEYRSCKPRKEHGDVVVVVSIPNLEQLGSPPGDFNLYWPPWLESIPLDDLGSLRYSTQCAVHRELYSAAGHGGAAGCFNSCIKDLGGGLDLTVTSDDADTTRDKIPVRGHSLNPGDPLPFDALDVQYCWSRTQDAFCKVEVMNPLLLIVALCFAVKCIQCCLVVWKLPDLSLITPGDAVQSFITNPDFTTFGLGTLQLKDSLRLENGPRRLLSTAADLRPDLTSRRFRSQIHRLRSSLPKIVWVRTYGVLAIGALPLICGLYFVITAAGGSSGLATFGRTDEAFNIALGSDIPLIGLVAFANCFQAVLSFCYFTYNSFFTRLQVEKEWNSYYLCPKPLRVSYPRGEQKSTYRLQLPYRWSIPLISLSALLHWVVSNSIFIFVVEGGYWEGSRYLGTGLNSGGIATIGFSPLATVILCSVSFFAMALPIALSLQPVRSGMVAGGFDSLVISAACHCHSAILSEKEQQLNSKSYGGSPERHDDDDENVPFMEEEEKSKRLTELALSKVQWGAVKPSKELLAMVTRRDEDRLMHLSFGGERADMREPLDDDYYA